MSLFEHLAAAPIPPPELEAAGVLIVVVVYLMLFESWLERIFGVSLIDDRFEEG